MTGWLLAALLAAPLAAVIGCPILRAPRPCEALNLVAGAVSFACALPLPFLLGGRALFYWDGYVILDRVSAWVVLCTAIVYFLASIYAVGYMRLLNEDRRLFRFYALFAGFALTTLAAPLMNNLGLYWIAIELTTLVSTFLVAFERAAESMEAAWKYIVIVSAGISLALLGTVLFYWAGSIVLGSRYQMTWAVLAGAAPQMNPVLLTLAFLLVLVGYGTKVGLAPMHTWLPDAHSESPAPVSAMLSGALLNTAMIGVARFLGVARSARLGALPQLAVVAFGAVSLLIGALFIVRQQGIKRLMAYSSVEHMGVVALGFGFGGALGVAGALYHMLNHSLNKSLMFFGAGSMMRAYGTKDIAQIAGVSRFFPSEGALWLAGAVAITGAPPFGLFLSEFTIMRAGLKPAFSWAVGVMAVLLIVIFVGFMNQFRRMYYTPDPVAGAAPAGRVSVWCAVPMWLSLAPLLALGLWWPAGIWNYLTSIAPSLSPGLP
ncbi:MAG TPA: proton-conducting transporter membrane subunit [Stellaceae bacterium]|jgi:hydrogenase-4 component F|nr:proton-conducting transporter membrane subunit [Stellaceae bacterium]